MVPPNNDETLKQRKRSILVSSLVEEPKRGLPSHVSGFSNATPRTTKTRRGMRYDGVSSKLIEPLSRYVSNFYAFSPSYRFGHISGCFGKFLSVTTMVLMVIFGISTLVAFITTPPQEIQLGTNNIDTTTEFGIPTVGFQLWYYTRDEETGQASYQTVDANNTDRYFTFYMYAGSRPDVPPYTASGEYAVQYEDVNPQDVVRCDRELPLVPDQSSFCIDKEQQKNYQLQGLWYVTGKHRDFYIEIRRCVNVTRTGETCADPDEITNIINNAPNVYLEMVVETNTFDPELYHKTGDGLRKVYSNLYSYLKVGSSPQHAVMLKHHKVNLENLWIGSFFGSPPQEFLQFENVVTTDIPQGTNGTDQETFMEVYLLLDPFMVESNVVYPISTLFGLFALWGGFFSIVRVSLGYLAHNANIRRFKRHFAESANEFIEGGNNSDTENGERDDCEQGALEEVDNVETQVVSEIKFPLDKLDIRLLDAENFDEDGRLVISREELLHPSTVFGELRLLALTEHHRKRVAAAKICEFYTTFVKNTASSDTGVLATVTNSSSASSSSPSDAASSISGKDSKNISMVRSATAGNKTQFDLQSSPDDIVEVSFSNQD